MSEQQVSSLMLIVLGGFFLYRNILLYRDEERLRVYLENSRKAKLWVSKFGMERVRALSRRYFIPLGILLAAVMLGAGIYGLISKYI